MQRSAKRRQYNPSVSTREADYPAEPTIGEILMGESTRNAGPQAVRDRGLVSRSMALRAETVDEDTRSIEAVLATENVVPVWDWATWREIDEILLISGMERVEQIPLLDNHKRWSLDDVFGSIRNIMPSGSETIVRLYFADLRDDAAEGDEHARRIERAWKKTKQKHQREISVGYRILESETIEAGKRKKIGSRFFTAGDKPLRVVTKWLPREGSLTPVAADRAATTRSDKEMNELLRYLITIGCRDNATPTEAIDFAAAVTDPAQRSEILRLVDADQTIPAETRNRFSGWRTAAPEGGISPSMTTPGAPNQTLQPRTLQAGETLLAGATNTQGTQVDGQGLESIRQASASLAPVGMSQEEINRHIDQRIADNNQRVNNITRLFTENGIDNDPLLQRAVADNWSVAQTAEHLLPLVRQRSNAVDNSGRADEIRNINRTQNALVCALILGRASDLQIDSTGFAHQAARRLGPNRYPSFLMAGVNDETRQMAMNDAHRYNDMSMVDVCRMLLALHGKQVPHNRQEMIERAFSSGAVQAVFTNSVNAMMVGGYADFPDSTRPWTTEEDLADFKNNERITMHKFGMFNVHAPGQTADHLDTKAVKYDLKLFRYSGKFVVDEIQIINDRLGAIDGADGAPDDMGRSAAQLRPNLVYSILFANDTIEETGAALFSSTHGNLSSGASTALSNQSIIDTEVALSEQRIADRPLNLPLNILLVPRQLKHTAKREIQSQETRDDYATVNRQGTNNTLFDEPLQYIADSRLGPNGVRNPQTNTRYTGTNTNWFGVSAPNNGTGARTIRVGYLRGSGRAPQLTSYLLSEGQWGMGWAMKMDIGAAAEGYRAMHKNTGAA